MKAQTLFPDDEPTYPHQHPRRNEQPPPMVRGDATIASRSADNRTRPKVRNQVALVYRSIQNAGTTGATDKEVPTALGLPGDSQRPRRVWLRDNGFIRHMPDEMRAGSAVWFRTGRHLELSPERKATT